MQKESLHNKSNMGFKIFKILYYIHVYFIYPGTKKLSDTEKWPPPKKKEKSANL